MKRRKAIINIFLIATAGITSVIGYELFESKKTPNLKSLSDYKMLLAELAEVIIPATDTPGAKDAKVEEFILNFIFNCEDLREQNNFADGLKNIQEYSYRYYDLPFEKCSLKNKIEILHHFESKGVSSSKIFNKVRTKIFGKSFFSQLKELTVMGYCTSEIGATQGLVYDYIPVVYESCIPLLPNQKSWATK